MNTIEKVIKMYEGESFVAGIVEEKVLRVTAVDEETFSLLTYDALNGNARKVEILVFEDGGFDLVRHNNLDSFEVSGQDVQALLNKVDAHDIVVAAEAANGYKTLHTNVYYMSKDGQRVAFVLYGDNEEESGALVYEVAGNVLIKIKETANIERLERSGMFRVEL